LGFLVVILGYYPLMMVGTTLGNQGALPPAAALWIGNAVLLALITFDARRLLKS
jgi:lipopolysaccharide export LptBFGC system permease protein LptF